MHTPAPDTGNRELDTLLMLCEVRGYELAFMPAAFRAPQKSGGVARIELRKRIPAGPDNNHPLWNVHNVYPEESSAANLMRRILEKDIDG